MRRIALGILIMAWLIPGRADYYPSWLSSDSWDARSRPNALDLMEYGLYWLRDWTGEANLTDPASLISLMEEETARWFDFGVMARRVADPWYSHQDVLTRAHFQHRLRDALFAELARQFGFYDPRPPRIFPLPRRYLPTGELVIGFRIWRPLRGPADIFFHFYRLPQGWRVVDVSRNGVRATDVFRAHFYAGELTPPEPGWLD